MSAAATAGAEPEFDPLAKQFEIVPAAC